MMHKAHEIIWLQVDQDGESCDPEQYDIVDDATWCKDQINSSDVKYVRADIYDKLSEQVKTLRDKVDWLRRYGCKDELAFRVAQEALDATEPKP